MNKITNIILAVCSMSILLFMSGCGKVVPPGTTILLVKTDGSSEVYTNGTFKAWGRDRAYIIDSTLKSRTEQMQILCADDINMSIDVKWLGSFETGQENQINKKTIDVIKNKISAQPTNRKDIKGFELSLDSFYNLAIKDIIRSTSRSVVSPYVTDNIRPEREKIQAEIKKRVLAKLEELNYPISTSDVMISNIDYPDSVTEMRQKIKQEELRDLENAAIAQANVAKARRNAELALEEGKAKVVAAKAEAQANEIINASLTSQILALRQFQALERLADGPNNNSVIVPYQAINPEFFNTVMIKDAVTTGK